MKLKDILAIAGKPGLHQFISQGRNGIIVESFANKKRMVVHSATKVSSLEDIAIYTEVDEVPLKEIFKKFHELEDGKQTIPQKSSNDELKAKFAEVLPEYDRDRVYVSDIKKIINWYNILIELDLLVLEDLEDEVEAETDENQNKDEVAPEKSQDSKE